MRDLWFKNAVIYSLDVDSYFDADGDGVGDFEGLTSRLDYLKGLGVTCIWLLPFYPSPNRDNGYDVIDYYSVDPRLGTLGDFVEFARQARERGIRILIDLVVNHTSDQHPWFQAARHDRRSRYRNYYVWSDDRPENADAGVVFPGVQESVWTYDEAAGAYYFHRFYRHQPDLNISNPAVQEEIRKVMGFWLELGVSGFRVDAAPFLIELPRPDAGESGSAFGYLETFRKFLSWRRGDAIALAEANVRPDRILDYFGDGDRLHMAFNFMVNQRLFLALARQRARPLIDALRASPALPSGAQWATFLRNHDELDLGRLSDEERQEVFRVFGPEPEMQIYGRGLRRRLAPMLAGDRRRLELAYSLLFSLPGTPVLWYGEEIGMGEDLSLQERNAVRTPMQWSSGPGAGFSAADPADLIRPVVGSGRFGSDCTNVARARREPDSLLNWLTELIRVRRECPEVGWGECRLMDLQAPQVIGYRFDWQENAVVMVHNFSDAPCPIDLNLCGIEGDYLVELFGDERHRRLEGRSHRIELRPFGYRWFRAGGGSLSTSR